MLVNGRLFALTTEAVKGTSLPLQGIDNIHCRYGLSFGMFGVGDSITNNVLQEDLQEYIRLLQYITLHAPPIL